MNRLYILICAIMLSGCGQSLVTRTAEEYNVAAKYCADNGAEIKLNYGKMVCEKNNITLSIPKKVFK